MKIQDFYDDNKPIQYEFYYYENLEKYNDEKEKGSL